MRKLNAQKYMRNINDNVVQGRLSENPKNYRTKYFVHEIFVIHSIPYIQSPSSNTHNQYRALDRMLVNMQKVALDKCSHGNTVARGL